MVGVLPAEVEAEPVRETRSQAPPEGGTFSETQAPKTPAGAHAHTVPRVLPQGRGHRGIQPEFSSRKRQGIASRGC